MSDTLEARFWAKVERRGPDDCWLWTAGLNNGYGTIYGGRRSPLRAHRVAYELLVGPIPDGLTLDHLCRNRRCVNPAHLEPVSNRENILRGESFSAEQARRTHCPSGHPLEGDNLRPDQSKQGKRACRLCAAIQQRERRARRREAAL